MIRYSASFIALACVISMPLTACGQTADTPPQSTGDASSAAETTSSNGDIGSNTGTGSGINLAKAAEEGAISSFAQSIVQTHNMARAEMGAMPLKWSANLTADAKAYADTLARRGGGLVHSSNLHQIKQGENLWSGGYGQFMPAHMIGRFIEEKVYFKSGIFPEVSTTGNWADLGHYTQVIWPETTEVGCALSVTSDRSREYLVCRYFPAGNITGVELGGAQVKTQTDVRPNTQANTRPNTQAN